MLYYYEEFGGLGGDDDAIAVRYGLATEVPLVCQRKLAGF
jgi:hypothetical protein